MVFHMCVAGAHRRGKWGGKSGLTERRPEGRIRKTNGRRRGGIEYAGNVYDAREKRKEKKEGGPQ